MSSGSLPATTLYPLIFALASTIILVIFVGLSLGVRKQKQRDQRFLMRQMLLEEAQLIQREKARPILFEIGGGKETWFGADQAASLAVKIEMPISVCVLPHPPNNRVLASKAPPIVTSVMILQPRPPAPPNALQAEGQEDEPGIEDDLELGLETVHVHGDWRKVYKEEGLGFM